MPQPTVQRIGIFLAALWWGSLSLLGAVVVPLLFKHLSSPAVAGAMAAQLFSAQTFVSMACSVGMLLIFSRKRSADPMIVGQGAINNALAYTSLGLSMAVFLDAVVAPRIAGARLAGAEPVLSLAVWHGLGTALYATQWLCATAALWRLTGSLNISPMPPLNT